MTYVSMPRVRSQSQLWLDQVCPYIPDGHVVYIMFGVDRTVYYVGRTSNAKSRLAEHAREPLKRNLVTRLVIIPLATVEDMISTELALIDALNPVWNSGRQ